MFAGKHGLITPRDLFKWAARGAVTYQQLAENGYMLLGERLRSLEERSVVQKALESVMNVKVCHPSPDDISLQTMPFWLRWELYNTKELFSLALALHLNNEANTASSHSTETFKESVLQLDMAAVYDEGGKLASQQADHSSGVGEQHGGVQGIVWTPSMRRMYTLLDRYSSHPILSFPPVLSYLATKLEG